MNQTTTPEPCCAPRASGRWRKWIKRISALLGGTITALFLGECIVRLWAPQVLFPRYVTDGGFGIRTNVPNARYWHTSPEMKVQFRMNSMGIRSDREYSYEKPPGAIRIVGIGDSFTQGYEVRLEDAYLTRLEHELVSRGYPIEIINLGVSGHGTAEELIMLREFGFRFDPDIVVLGYFQNDPEDNVRSNLYRLDALGQLGRADAAYLPAVGLRDTLYSFWWFRFLSAHSQLFALVREQTALAVKSHLAQKQITQMSTDNEYESRLTARLLDQVKWECAKRGVEFLLLDIPGPQVSRSNLPKTYLFSIADNEIVHTGPELEKQPPNSYLYRRQGHRHWTERGHEIAADLLADKIAAMLDHSPR